ncbi:hypothetical protein ACLI1A_06870 [Flavobacterium sp. RHBU_3]|uniref:hypothetical protein n=1 Tax=Flavobacterium sp. RHBU_3 TaxID=3391184 RepID=UPI003984AEF3
MKQTILATLLLASFFTACKKEETNADTTTTDSIVAKPATPVAHEEDKDKEEITQLIRKTLVWADGKAPHLLPGVLKEGDSIYSGVDFEQLQKNLELVKDTGFFAKEFIDNCDKIAKTIDKKVKANEYGPWDSREYPPFNIYSEVNPWCDCQDHRDWNKVKTEVVILYADRGELYWQFETHPGDDPSWREFSYTFRVVKEGGKWKISYLQGFDYNEAIKGF